MTDAQFIEWLKTPDAIRVVLVTIYNVGVGGVPTTFRLSNRPYITGGSDVPAHFSYTPCIVGGVSFTERLELTGGASSSLGDIEISNLDGLKDGWLNYNWINKSIEVSIGDPRFALSNFKTVFKGVVKNIYSRNLDSLNLVTTNELDKLDVPLLEETITLSDGKAYVPLTFGECFNVVPALKDPSTLVYKVHSGLIEDIIEVRDNGYPVEVTKDVANGQFTLKNRPYGTITASVQGSASPTYQNTVGELVQRILTSYGPAASRTLPLDTSTFSTFTAAHPQPVGVYVNEEGQTKREVLESLCKSVGAALATDRLGNVRPVKIAIPASGTVTYVTAKDMYHRTLEISDRSEPLAAIKLGYCKNWTPSVELAAGIVESNIEAIKSDWYFNTSVNTVAASDYSISSTAEAEETLLLTQLDADNESDRRLALWQQPRMVLTATYYSHLMLVELGSAMNITFPRYNLNNGVTGTVVFVERNWLESKITIGVLM